MTTDLLWMSQLDSDCFDDFDFLDTSLTALTLVEPDHSQTDLDTKVTEFFSSADLDDLNFLLPESDSLTHIDLHSGPSHTPERRFECLPLPKHKEPVPDRDLYRINHPELSHNGANRTHLQHTHINWGLLGFSTERGPSRRRIIERSDAKPSTMGTLAVLRGHIYRKNINDLVDAVDNLIIITNPKFSQESTYAPNHYLIERDLTEFHVFNGSRLQLIRDATITIDTSHDVIELSNVEVQFVVDCSKNVVYGHCRVYVEENRVLANCLVSIRWTNPQTLMRENWCLSRIAVVMGSGNLRVESKHAICPYCPEVRTFNLKCLGYLNHLVEHHGVLLNGELIPDPVEINGRTVCTHCSTELSFENHRTTHRFIAYCRHWNKSKGTHKSKRIHWRKKPVARATKDVDVVDLIWQEFEDGQWRFVDGSLVHYTVEI